MSENVSENTQNKPKYMDNISLRFLHRAKKDKATPLYIEVRICRTNKATLINTGIKLYDNQFSDKMGFTCRNHDRAKFITQKARDVFTQVEAFAMSDECLTLDDVKNYNNRAKTTLLVTDFIRRMLAKRTFAVGTAAHHRVLINKLEAFGKITTFNTLTYENILDFDVFLRRTINSSTLMYKRHKTLKNYIVEAIKLGLVDKNPYDKFTIKKGHDKERVFLSVDEIRKIQECEVEGKLVAVKDLFVVQMFTGLAYIDLMALSVDKIEEQDGYKVIRSNRHKTDESFIVLLLPEAEEILERYDYNLPKISNQKYNDYIKVLACRAGITKVVTSHVARHTFATYLLNKGIPMETVSRALGHTNIGTTKIYAKMLGSTVIDDMKKLIK